MILNDRLIRQYCEQGMLTPFDSTAIRKLDNGVPAISSGIGPYGYDVKLDPVVKIMTSGHLTQRHDVLMDPKRPETLTGLFYIAEVMKAKNGERWVILPPRAFALSKCLPRFNLPKHITAFCMTKSTYARIGVSVKTTPVQAGHQGDVVLEISNLTDYPAKLYVDEGIAQFFFFEGDELPQIDYAESGGVYHGQSGITLPRVKDQEQ